MRIDDTALIRNMVLWQKYHPKQRSNDFYAQFHVTSEMENLAFWKSYSWLLQFPASMMPPSSVSPAGF